MRTIQMRCLLLCKDRNFKANHNWSVSTEAVALRCLLLCKDRNFKANHNRGLGLTLPHSDVCYSAKIGILKQITTGNSTHPVYLKMFVTLQR